MLSYCDQIDPALFLLFVVAVQHRKRRICNECQGIQTRRFYLRNICTEKRNDTDKSGESFL